MSSNKSSIVLKVSEWNPKSHKYLPPKLNKNGVGKNVGLISTQTSRSLNITTPFMSTWGPGFFTNEKGESDTSKCNMALICEDIVSDSTEVSQFLEKVKEFENNLIDDAVKNSELWWGEPMSREVVKHSFFPFLKYPKNKDTKKIDYTRTPSFNTKIPFYNDKWGIEIYDTGYNLLLPSENEDLTPMDFIPKRSIIASVLQCSGIWIGGKGWGLTWKVVQTVVKPVEVESIYGRCRIEIPDSDKSATIPSKPPALTRQTSEVVSQTFVEESDDEETSEDAVIHPEAAVVEETKPATEEVVVVEPEPEQVAVVETATEAAATSVVPKKKVIKKKV
jgi:hypothetical protein